MAEITRYKVGNGAIQAHSDGNWVEFDDASALITQKNAEIADLGDQVKSLESHLEEIRVLDPDWHEIQLTMADAIDAELFATSIKHHEEVKKKLRGVIAGTHEIVLKAPQPPTGSPEVAR